MNATEKPDLAATLDQLAALDTPWTVDRADSFAAVVHHGQEDKAGAPYIDHPRRVLGYLDELTPPSMSEEQREHCRLVALLHDVLEDAHKSHPDTPMGPDQLRRIHLPEPVVTALAMLCHPDDGVERTDEEYLAHYQAYVEDLASDLLARTVKRADLEDNTDPARMARLTASGQEWSARKYGPAKKFLSGLHPD